MAHSLDLYWSFRSPYSFLITARMAIKVGAVIFALALHRLMRNLVLALFAAAGLAVLVRWLVL